jgi:hypothetical protein
MVIGGMRCALAVEICRVKGQHVGMINLKPAIDRIRALIAEDTDASLTYAALEARLALEKVCYDRLRQAHDYIAHAELRKWQPAAVMNRLIADVDQHAADSLKLLISKNPAVPGVEPADDEFVEVGTQIGFDVKKMGELWNALSGLALHVKLPKDSNDSISAYGDRDKIKSKVKETLVELEHLAAGAMTFSGFGETVSFDCTVCGEKIKRRAALLREGQRVFSINPDCDASFLTRILGSEIEFEGEICNFNCQDCGAEKVLPWRFFREKLKFGDRAVFDCRGCNHRNYIEWRLYQVAPVADETEKPSD